MIGYYVHHHGRGHLHRAVCVARCARTPITGLSSLPRPDGWAGDWVRLPIDTGPPGRPVADPTAGGRLHWAPLGHEGLRGRMAITARWIARAAPELFVSDVSVEMACLARLMGVRIAVMAMRGNRLDAPHDLAYTMADALIAPWPAALPEPDWPEAWRSKTAHVGAFSRYDGRPVPARGERANDPRPRPRVAVLLGAGGSDVSGEELREARAATPEWEWQVLGHPDAPWCEDPWPVLCGADVLVTHGGQNAIAECAAARRPTICIPQDRPFGEQRATGRALAAGGLAVVRPHWPSAAEWPRLLESTRRRDGSRWAMWAPGDGATRAAAVLDAPAASPVPGGHACASP
ncbi:glycosyltransferase [Embleya scabrispora]|uniref:glycosyltransferase n=1 Tax=Embleya scabrispora TaxID=159449 RepID=UPI000C7A046F|nr:glycosyltransferase [Embleya scabrispora]